MSLNIKCVMDELVEEKRVRCSARQDTKVDCVRVLPASLFNSN